MTEHLYGTLAIYHFGLRTLIVSSSAPFQSLAAHSQQPDMDSRSCVPALAASLVVRCQGLKRVAKVILNHIIAFKGSICPYFLQPRGVCVQEHRVPGEFSSHLRIATYFQRLRQPPTARLKVLLVFAPTGKKNPVHG